jgi:hypothetical protein
VLLIFFFAAREISKLGDLLDLDVCMDILDILYETEDTSLLFNSPCSLAASTLVCFLHPPCKYSIAEGPMQQGNA